MHQIARSDIVVATRYHNVICALKMRKPTVSIGYADKNDVLMAAMGLRGFCQHIERLNVDLLIDQVGRLIADRQRYEQGVPRPSGCASGGPRAVAFEFRRLWSST